MYKEFTQEQKEKEIQKIKDFEALMPENEVYLMFGTLLGAIREKGLIDNDCDVDVCYLSKYHTAKEVAKEMEDIHKTFLDKGILLNYFTRDESQFCIEVRNREEPITEIYKPLGHFHVQTNSGSIDVFASWIDEKGDLYTPLLGNIHGQANQYFPLVKTNIYGIEVKIPNNAEKLIEILYGEEWRIPKQEGPHHPTIKALTVWLGE